MAPLRIFPLLALLLALVVSGCSPAADPRAGPVVLAPSSLQESLSEIAAQWQASGHAPVVLSFAGTPALARQVEAGAPADVVISADPQWMDWMAERRLVTQSTRVELVANSLVWIAHDAPDAAIPVAARAALLGAGRIALADPQAVPAGRYARLALDQMGLWQGLASHVVPAENVRAALALVENGEARYGIVYATDALASDRVTNAGAIPAEFGQPIRYPAALVARSAHPDAQRFLDFLAGEQAALVFRQHGFSAIAPCPSC